ncbi:MAG: hydrogenase expression/formation C-terminal domain-containing protein [Pseudomonadota bacterium]
MEIFRHPKVTGPGTFEEEAPVGVFLAPETDELKLLDMPSGVEGRGCVSIDALEAADPAVARLLQDIAAKLRVTAAGGPGGVLPLTDLSLSDRLVVADVLGTGEVEIRIGGEPTYVVEETALAGVWRAQARDEAGVVVAEWLEVADVPVVVREAVAAHAAPELPLPDRLPAGCMNVGPLLHELRERMAGWQPDQPNHVVSFTLFPMSPEDMRVLGTALGVAPIDIRSKGYGSCRIVPTRRSHVWGVQYLNVMDTVILDTLEVGDVPTAVVAAREDFEDSAVRLLEILDACFPAAERR